MTGGFLVSVYFVKVVRYYYVQACCHNQVEQIEDQYQQHNEMIQALYERDEKKLVDLIVRHEAKFHVLPEEMIKILNHPYGFWNILK